MISKAKADPLRASEAVSMWLEDRCKTALMAVKTCSEAISAPSRGHGKSPCFLQVAFLRLVSPDYPLSVLPCVDGQELLECAI